MFITMNRFTINPEHWDDFELISKNLWFNPFQSRNRYDSMPAYRAIGEWILQH